VLEGLDPVAQSGRLLVAELVRQACEPGAKARERSAVEDVVELGRGARGEGARREGSPPSARDRAELGRGLRDDQLVATPPQIDAVLPPAAARVGGWLELANQPQFLERGFELGAKDAPLDPFEREQRGLDRRPLALAAEVGAQPGPQVPRAADIEHLPVCIAEEVDPRPRGGAMRERAFVVDPPLRRCGEPAQIGEASRAELLGEPDQAQEHFRRRLGVRQRAVARLGRDSEEVREGRESDAAQASGEEAAGERGRTERRLGQTPPVQEAELALEEALVEASVVRDEHVVSREGEEAFDDGRDWRRPAQILLAQPGQARDGLRECHAGVHERLEGVDDLESADAHRSELADPVALGREPRGLEVEDDEVGFDQERVGPSARERDGCPLAHEPAVARGDVRNQ
jgi:hypothetical protein